MELVFKGLPGNPRYGPFPRAILSPQSLTFTQVNPIKSSHLSSTHVNHFSFMSLSHPPILSLRTLCSGPSSWRSCHQRSLYGLHKVTVLQQPATHVRYYACVTSDHLFNLAPIHLSSEVSSVQSSQVSSALTSSHLTSTSSPVVLINLSRLTC